MATSNFSCPPPFNSDEETITEFLERLKVQQAEAFTKAGADGIKKARILIKSLPTSIVTDLQRRIKPALLSETSYTDLEAKLLAQFDVKKSAVGAAVKFLNRKQGADETIEHYAQVLNDLAASCNYADCCRDRLIRDAFVSGLRSTTVLTALLQKCESKTFNECVEFAKLFEQLTSDARDIHSDIQSATASRSYKVTQQSSTKNQKKVPANYVCIRCGEKAKHFATACFAINLQCKLCSKLGHLAKVCKSSKGKHRVHLATADAEAGNQGSCCCSTVPANTVCNRDDVTSRCSAPPPGRGVGCGGATSSTTESNASSATCYNENKLCSDFKYCAAINSFDNDSFLM